MKPKTKKRRASGPDIPEARRRALGSPVNVSARYPQDLLAAIDAARGETPRQAWLVQAARDRLARLESAEWAREKSE